MRRSQAIAIDTAAKRAQVSSLVTLGALGIFGILPIPDGTVGQADRQHLSGFYGGILADAPSDPIVYRVEAQGFSVGGAQAAGFSVGGAVKAGVSVGGAVAAQAAPLAGG